MGLRSSATSGFQAQTLSALDWRFLPLAIEQECFAVLGVYRSSQGFQSEQLAAIDALITQVAMAWPRTRLATTLEQAKVAEETERLRSALLSSVSRFAHPTGLNDRRGQQRVLWTKRCPRTTDVSCSTP
ncbi:MAG: hypothetical protein MZV65_20615 [Chromatiales bacterium]|nr:hypothetical protein [Chromatiales bacterium]